MWDDTDNKIFEFIEKITPELDELYRQRMDTNRLRDNIQRIRTATLLTTSTEWTDEAREHMCAIADHAADAIKSLDDKIKSLNLKIKALEASL